MHVHCLQHVSFEPPGSIETWLRKKGHTLSFTHFFGEAPPVLPASFDALVIMGGPMSVHDEEEYPWLILEKQWIADAFRQDKKILGICLGAQLIAAVSGAGVYRNPVPEIGVFPVELTEEARESPFFRHFPWNLKVLHWHGETFDLPPGALHLAFTASCRNQAFLLGDKVLGLQFHLESTPEILREMVIRGKEELVPSPTVQSAEVLVGESAALEAGRQALYGTLERFFG